MAMPLIFSVIAGFGISSASGMALFHDRSGVMMWSWLICITVYKDTPAEIFGDGRGAAGPFFRRANFSVLADWRIGALALAYAMLLWHGDHFR